MSRGRFYYSLPGFLSLRKGMIVAYSVDTERLLNVVSTSIKRLNVKMKLLGR